jgi:hypothetical protein
MQRKYRDGPSSQEDDVKLDREESSDSQEISLPSDGHTGMSQDFDKKMNTASTPTSARTTKQEQASAVPVESAPKLMQPPTRTTRKSIATAAASAAVAATSSTSTAVTVSTPVLSATATSAPAQAIKSFGTVCVVSRPSTNKKNNIKSYALQNTFYAYPADASPDTKKTVSDKIKEIADNFEFQKYDIKVYEFELPFEVEEVCRISGGYGMTPKRHKIAGGKRKRAEESLSSSSDLEDCDEDESVPVAATTSASKKRK